MKNRKTGDIIRFTLIVAIVLVLNVIGGIKFFRLDLTSEKRYTLSDATKDLLQKIDDVVFLKVYLEGDFPAGFQRLQSETRQMLDEFRAYNPNIQYVFVNPNDNTTEEETEELYQQLESRGLRAYRLQVNKKGGNSMVNIFPGAIMSLGSEEVALSLLIDQLGASPEAQINSSIQTLEFTLANSIRSLVVKDKPSIGFLQGHGEADPFQLADLARSLAKNYSVDLFNIRKFKSDTLTGELSLAEQQRFLNRFDALVIAKPQTAFNDLDKYLIDQFVMNGGKTIWMIDPVKAEMDSLSEAAQFLSLPIYDRLNIGDLLFKYGVRVNTNMVVDLVAAGVNDQRNIYPWIYSPLIMPVIDHPITKDLNAVRLIFSSSLDTVITNGSKKTVLLQSSPYSATFPTPHVVNLNYLYSPPPKERMNKNALPLAILVEGHFESLYKNRIAPKDNGEPLKLKTKVEDGQMVVIGDGDIGINQLNVVNPNLPKRQPLPLGYDQYTGQQYGNKDFLLNVMDYLLDESGLISIRSRELKLRLLDYTKLEKGRLKWQLLNSVLPVLLVVLYGVVYSFIRKRKYAS